MLFSFDSIFFNKWELQDIIISYIIIFSLLEYKNIISWERLYIFFVMQL